MIFPKLHTFAATTSPPISHASPRLSQHPLTPIQSTSREPNTPWYVLHMPERIEGLLKHKSLMRLPKLDTKIHKGSFGSQGVGEAQVGDHQHHPLHFGHRQAQRQIAAQMKLRRFGFAGCCWPPGSLWALFENHLKHWSGKRIICFSLQRRFQALASKWAMDIRRCEFQ